MAQQPLTGRGLSQTILQPTDILGEAQLRQQQEQLLAARQQAAQKPTKASRIDFDLEKAGDIYSGIYNEAYKQIEKFATENADRLDENSFFYDKELRRKFETTLAVVNSASSMMRNNDAIVREDFKDLSENQKSTSGAANLLKNVAGLSKGVKVDFDNMDFGITGEDGSFESYDQIEYITNPRGSYYRRQTWVEDLEEKLDKTFIDENGVREAYKEKIDGQIDIYFNNLDNSPDYQYSVIADYLQDSNDGIGIPDARKNALNIIRRLVESEDGTYTLPNGKVITREEALDWGKNQVKEAWYNKHGLSVDKGKEGKTWNWDSWFEKSGVRPIKGRKFYFEDGTKIPMGAVAFETDAFKVPVTREMFPKQAPGEIATAFVDVAYTDGDDIFVNIRGLRQNGSYLSAKNIKLTADQVGNLEGKMGLPREFTLFDVLEQAGGVKTKDQEPIEIGDSQQEEETSQTWIYNGDEYTIEQIRKKYGEDFDPSEYQGFELKQ